MNSQPPQAKTGLVKHKIKLENYNGSLEMLAEELGDLRYDALVDFLTLLSAKIERDIEKDFSKNRVKLASYLANCALELNRASVAIEGAWQICSPYCQEEE